MNRELQLVRAIALQADTFYEKSRDFGNRAGRYFGVGGAGRTQVRQLESIANSALKVADVLDFIKKQIGKDKDKDKKDKSWSREDFGLVLLRFLENDLRTKAESLDVSPHVENPAERQRVHLQLIREFVHQLAAQFEIAGLESAG
jgi:hypothetical protein